MDNNWTLAIEEHITEVSTKCINISRMHGAQADRCHKINWCINAVVIILSATLAIFQVLDIIEEETNKIKITSYVRLSITVALVALSQLNQFGRFEEKKGKNIQAAADFEVLYNNIRQTLANKCNNRPPVEEYQSYVHDIYSKLIRCRPYISIKYQKQYTNDEPISVAMEMNIVNKKLAKIIIERTEISSLNARLHWEMNRFENNN